MDDVRIIFFLLYCLIYAERKGDLLEGNILYYRSQCITLHL